MRRRQTSQSSMSLFPFLDTLVCTMGALILMLLAMTPRIKERALARQAALQPAVSPAVEPDPEPEPDPPAAAATLAPLPADEHAPDDHAAVRERRREAWLKHAADARTALAARQADFQRRRDQLQDTERRLRDLEDQILKTQLKSENAGQAAESLAERTQKLEAQAALVAQKIAATRKNIDLAQRRQTTAKNEYALVAYDGVSGTVRRPIYIECTGKGFRFLPEDETVSPVDLEGFSDGFNPLLAGAQTLVRFWARRKRSAGPAEPEPYVLLVVRPSGCFTYYLARKYLSTLGVHWGYELIEEDWKLSVPEPDPVAKTMLKETLDATAQVRRPSKRDVAAGERDFGRPFDPREFDRDEWPFGTDGDDAGSGSGRTDRAGTAGRKPAVRQGYATRNDRGAGDPFPGDRPLGRAPGDGPNGRPVGAVAVAGTPGAAGGPAGAKQTSGIGGGGRAPGTGGPAGNRDQTDSEPRSPGGIPLAATGAAGRGTGGPPARAGKPGGVPGARSATADSSASAAEGEGGSNSEPATLRTGAAGAARRARPASLGGASDSEGDGDHGDGDGDEGSPAGAAGDDELSMSSPSAAGTDASAVRNPGARGNPATAADGASDPAPRASWLSDPDGNPSGAGSSPRNVKMGGPGATVSLGSSRKRRAPDADSDDGPRISENDGRPHEGPAVRSRAPRKWGQVGRRAGIGFEKKVNIYLNDRRIVVDSKDNVIPVGPGDSGEEIVNRVAASIDSVADSWGEPPSNFYWVPVVKFMVYPGGNANYARLQSALEQHWGVSSTVEYAPDPKSKKAGGGGRR